MIRFRWLGGCAAVLAAVVSFVWPAPVSAAPAPATLSDLQVLVTSGGGLYHAIRLSSTGAWLGFNPVSPAATIPSSVGAVSAAGIGGELHVVLDNNALYHAIRYPGGAWNGFNTAPAPTGRPTGAAVGALGGDLYVFVAQILRPADPRGNLLLYTVRHADGAWGEGGPAPGGVVSGFLAAGGGGALHLVTTGSSGVQHSMLTAAGWAGPNTVSGWATIPPSMGVVAAAVVGADLHVLGLDGAGHLYHAIRHASTGAWSGFNAVEAFASVPLYIDSVAAAGVNGDLQVLLTTRSGALYHAIRHTTSGSWSGFNDVSEWANVPPNPMSVTAAATQAGR
jgi:hypothetical protein